LKFRKRFFHYRFNITDIINDIIGYIGIYAIQQGDNLNSLS